MPKPYECGMIVGRFQNFHKGHEKLIRTSVQLCDRTVVLVGSSQEAKTEKNPYDVHTRIEMIKSVFDDAAEVIVDTVTDISDEGRWGNHLL